MSDDDNSNEPPEKDEDPPVQVSGQDAAALIKILLERGYFHHHANNKTVRSEDDVEFQIGGEDDRSTVYVLEDALLIERSAVTTTTRSSSAEHIPAATTGTSYITLDRLTEDFETQLRERGRWSIQEASSFLGVSAGTLLRRIVPRVLAVDEDNVDDNSRNKARLSVIKSPSGEVRELRTASYMEERMNALWTKLAGGTTDEEHGGGIMSVAEAAESILELPLEVAVQAIEERIAAAENHDHDASVQIRLNDHGSKVLVTHAYLERLQEDLKNVFVESKEPLEVQTVAKKKGWEVCWVLPMIQELNNSNSLPGEFHGETYVPDQFTEREKRAVLELYSTNGLVTAHTCQSLLGLLPHQMKEYVLQQEAAAADDGIKESSASVSSALVLENSVVNRDVIVAPLVATLQDLMESSSSSSSSAGACWLDLQIHLPPELLDHHTEDARTLVEDYVLPELSGRGDGGGAAENVNDGAAGLAVIRSDGALFLSRALIEEFTKKQLSDLVQTFAQSRAKELFDASEDVLSSRSSSSRRASDDETTMTAKEKRKARKASKAKQSSSAAEESHQNVEYGTVPFDDILRRLLEAHPDLSDLEDTSCDSVLAEACRIAFCTDDLDSLCWECVRNELDRLFREKTMSMSRSASARKEEIGAFPSIDAAFEQPECFANCCYFVQAKSKFLDYAFEHSEPPVDEKTKEALEKDFLTGCCADFTRRITEFALYKNNVEEHSFAFLSQDASNSSFFSPIELGTRSYNKVYLSCEASADGKQRDPLPLLREVLPGSVGVALARQWALCGGECFQGGAKLSFSSDDDGGEAYYIRPGDVSGFLAHAQENCLPICGLPFTKLDKKSEKRFLNARRQRLMQLLEETSDVAAALDFAIMLLYQLAKNLVVSGTPLLLRGQILQMLVKERKVSEEVAAELCVVAENIGLTYAEKLEKGTAMDDDELLVRIKNCVLAKSKS